MTRWKIERGIERPQRGPKSKYASLPLKDMNRGDSIKVAECVLSKRTPTYISVRKAVNKNKLADPDVNGEFSVTTKTVKDNVCEVRVWRIR